MIKVKCGTCGKEIEGYSKEHAEYLLIQHKITHRFKIKKGKNERK